MIDDAPVQTADILVKSSSSIAYCLGYHLDRLDTSQNIGPGRLAIYELSAGATDFGDHAPISAIGNDLCQRRALNMSLPFPWSLLTLTLVTTCNAESQCQY
jgi:hypothetical protein